MVLVSVLQKKFGKILNSVYMKAYMYLVSKIEISLKLKPFKFHSKFLYSLPGPFFQILRQITAMNPQDAGAIITHCSAWVGRTGGLHSD